MLNDYISYIFIGLGILGSIIILLIVFSLYFHFSKLKRNNKNKKEKENKTKLSSDFDNHIINNVKIEVNQKWYLNDSNFEFTIVDINTDLKNIRLINENNQVFTIDYILFSDNYHFDKNFDKNIDNNKEKVA